MLTALCLILHAVSVYFREEDVLLLLGKLDEFTTVVNFILRGSDRYLAQLKAISLLRAREVCHK